MVKSLWFRFWFRFLLLLACLFPMYSHATEILGIEIPGLHEKNGKGEYDGIINKYLVDKGLATLKIYPPKRAEANFTTCTNCCISPANLNPDFYEYGADHLVTVPMGVAKVYAFHNKSGVEFDSWAKLKGLKVGIRSGMPYGKSFEQAGLDTTAVGSIEQNIKKIGTGRIDVFIAYTPDAYTAFESMGMKPLTHNKEQPLAVHPDSMVCKGVSKKLIQAFNDGVNSQ